MEEKPAQPSQSAATPQVGMDVVMPPKAEPQPTQAATTPAPSPAAPGPEHAPTTANSQPAPQPAPKPQAKAPSAKKPKQPHTAPVGVIIVALLVMVALCTAAVMVYQQG